MTESESRVRGYEIDVKMGEIRVRRAKESMDNGYKRLQAEFEKARADFEEGYSKLKSEFESAQQDLERYKVWLERAKFQWEKEGYKDGYSEN